PPVAEEAEVPEGDRLRGERDRHGLPEADPVHRIRVEVEAEQVSEDERRRDHAELDHALQQPGDRDGQLPHAALRSGAASSAAGRRTRPIAAIPSVAQRYLRPMMSKAAPCTTSATRPATAVSARSAAGWRAMRNARHVAKATRRCHA